MNIIVGLGNIGLEYSNTLHNMGFWAIMNLCNKYRIQLDKLQCKAVVGRGRIAGRDVLLAMPQTYMNLSGQSVLLLQKKYKVPSSDIIVVYDDIDLPRGKIRVRSSGSAGTHNGMRNIISELDTQDFPRVRIGIGRPPGGVDLGDYVISQIPQDERDELKESVNIACDEIVKLLIL